jgi:hypothetical protein
MHMKLNNPFAQHDLDMQDIKGDHYGLMNPALKILRAEGPVCLLLACTLYPEQGFSWMTFGLWFFFPDAFPLGFRVTHLGVLRGMRDKA